MAYVLVNSSIYLISKFLFSLEYSNLCPTESTVLEMFCKCLLNLQKDIEWLTLLLYFFFSTDIKTKAERL